MSTEATERRIGVKQRAAEIVAGHTFKIIEEWVVDRFIYTLVVGYLVNIHGAVYGGLLGMLCMLPVTAILCLLYIRVYDYLGRDLFGFELMKELKEIESGGVMTRLFATIARKGDVFAFIALSVWKDAFMTSVYFRKKGQNGMSSRDHRIFWSSLVVSNAWWALLVTGVTSSFWIMYHNYYASAN